MGPDDPYSILGIDRDASDEQIRAAFRDAIRRSHPDRIGAKASHQSITALIDAWRLLRDPANRARLEECDRPGVHSVVPSDPLAGSQPVAARTCLLMKGLFLITWILTVAAVSILFVIAMAQSG
jgi:hypothetical protein